jgi:hypothetical protein
VLPVVIQRRGRKLLIALTLNALSYRLLIKYLKRRQRPQVLLIDRSKM